MTAVPPLHGHVFVYRYGPAVTSLVEELDQARVPLLILEEDEPTARRLQEHGRTIWEAFDPQVVSRPTPATIASYEVYAGPTTTTAAPAPVDDALKDRLRALGYIQ